MDIHLCKKCDSPDVVRLGIVEQYINDDYRNELIFNEPTGKEYHCTECEDYTEIYSKRQEVV